MSSPYTLDRILSVTRTLVLQHGCKKTTLKQIIAESGVSNGGVYHYVKSKDEIYGLILQQHINHINQRFYREAEMNLEGPVSIVVHELFGESDECRAFRSVFLYLISQPENPRIREIMNGFQAYWIQIGCEWIQLGQKDGVIDASLDPHLMSSYILSYYFGLLVKSACFPDESIFKPELIIGFVTRVLQP